jgi:putative restriction endonuclease
MLNDEEEKLFRESVFSWIRARQLTTPFFTREDLRYFEFQGSTHRLIGPYTGIWTVTSLSDSAISFSTSYVPDGKQRPYEDGEGPDGLQRYKWRGTDPNQKDNRALRRSMERGLPLLWLVGIGYVPGTNQQLYDARFPVFLIGEEPVQHQFVVALEEGQGYISSNEPASVREIVKRYNERIVKTRYHQPLFRARVIHAYQERCAICRLPFTELLEAAHIRPDSEGGSTKISNGMSLCKIHHGAYDSNIIGISPDYKIHVRDSVLATFDGPTLQHSIKEMDGEELRQIPELITSRPDRELLAERFEKFKKVS